MNHRILLLYLSLFILTNIKAEDEHEDPSNTEIGIECREEVTFAPIPPTVPTPPNPNDDPDKTVYWTKPVILDANDPVYSKVSTIKFKNNVVYNPGKNYTYPTAYTLYPAAIIINKNNVTIDLSGYSLSLDPSSATGFYINSPMYGISILPGVKNIKIISSDLSFPTRKGSINSFSGYAIYGFGFDVSYTYDPFANMIKDVYIDNLLITNNYGGISITNAIDVTITNTIVVYSFAAYPTNGIYLKGVTSGIIENTKSNLNMSYNNIAGFNMVDTVGLCCKNCESNLNKSLVNGDAVGFRLDATSELKSHDNQLIQCVSSSNLCSYTENARSIAFYLRGGSYHNYLTKCESYTSTHGGLYGSQPVPIHPPLGFGIFLEGSNANLIEFCKVAFHDYIGMYDDLLISTSSFTNNFSSFNAHANYFVSVPGAGGLPVPLPTVVVYTSDLSALDYTTPLLANVSGEYAT